MKLLAQTHIYLANDNHTDYFWSGNVQDHVQVALNEIDYYLDQADATQGLEAPYQGRYNLDGAWYAYTYRQHRSQADFNRLISRIRSGHISLPYNLFVSTYGGQPTEAILRGMYWQGRLARTHDLDLKLAVSMENQTLPLGLASLWAGAGARYSWKGVCGCNSPVNGGALANRDHEIYRYRGLDGTGLVMKWYSLTNGNQRLGGYAEARNPSTAVSDCEAKSNSSKYPYHITGAFGHGWDDLETLTDAFVQTAQSQSNSNRQVYVSNEYDFFDHFLSEYDPEDLPVETVTYGNDWDMDCAALASVTSRLRFSIEKLRTAEALAGVAALLEPDVYPSEDIQREKMWIALGSYWEHNFGLGGCCSDEERGKWQIDLQEQVTDYVDQLYDDALDVIARHLPHPAGNERFFVFNPLGWTRTDVAEVPFSGPSDIRVIDLTSGEEVPFQLITRNDERLLQVLAPQVPSVGYKVFEIRPEAGSEFPPAAALNGNVFENEFFRLTLTPAGAITSLVDKRQGDREFVAPHNGRYLNDFGQGTSEAGTLTLVHNGPVSATVACTSAQPLQHTTLFTLYRDIDRIDIQNQISDNFGDNIRTYSFAFNFNTPTVWHEELGAVLNAKYTSNGGHYATPDRAVRHDWQTLNHFVDMGTDQTGITLSNLGAAFMKLGNSSTTFLDENAAQIHVLIGGRMGGSGPGFANQYGLTDFRNDFSLKPRSGPFRAARAMQFALEHQSPFVAGSLSGNNEENNLLPESEFSLVRSSDPDLILWHLKPAEEGTTAGGWVTRFWNLNDSALETTLTFATDVLGANRITHLESDLETLDPGTGKLSVKVGRQHLASYRVFLDELPIMTDIDRPGQTAPFEIRIFPVPSADTLYIETAGGKGPIHLHIYHIDGRHVSSRWIEADRAPVDVSRFARGMYLFSFENQGYTVAKKVLIR